MDTALLLAIIGALGVGSQWLAWRLQLPAIVLMLVVGLLAGPVTGWINPEREFGDLFRPLVSVAVALILFEGGITLNFKALRDAGPAVSRLVFLGGPLVWIASSLVAHYAGGLSLETAIIFGGVLVVTGPTVVTPLLRQARLDRRPSEILRWEAIVNDPLGALAAVFAFEIALFLHGEGTFAITAGHLVLGIVLATIVGYVAGRGLVFAFSRGHVPEYMKVPVLLGLVLIVYATTDHVLHESGLLAVTIMGVVIGNAHLPSLGELRRFKEHVTVLLVSGVFIMLAASMERDMLLLLNWQTLAFVVLIMVVARPVAVMLALAFTDLSWKERIIVAWIGPRGIVAVAVSGLFGTRLVDAGIEDGALLAPYAFALVAATVVAHGFTIRPLAKLFDLTLQAPPGVLLAGGSDWSVALAKLLKEANVPVLVTDRNWFRLRRARQEEIPTFYGEILSETAEHTIDHNYYTYLLAVSDNDDYNALICTDYAPEFGRNNVLQLSRYVGSEKLSLPETITGRVLAEGMSYDAFSSRYREGWVFRKTDLSEEFTLDNFRETRPESIILAVIKPSGTVRFLHKDHAVKIEKTDALISFGPPAKS